MKINGYTLNLLCAVAGALRATDKTVERDAAGVPTAFRLMAPGPIGLTKDGVAMSGEWTAEDTAAVVGYQKTKGAHVPLDCEHFLGHLATHLGKDEAELAAESILGESAAAGLLSFEDRAGELWARIEKLADRARDLLAATGDKLYGYFSPFFRGLKDGPLRITSVALTNSPALNGQDVLAASEADLARKTAVSALGAVLGLDAAALADEPKVVAAATAKLVELLGKAQADAQALAEANAKLATTEKAALLDRLEAEGKLTAALRKDWAEGQDVAALNAWARSAPVIGALAAGKTQRPAAAKTAPTDPDVLHVCRQLGIDPAKMAV